MFQPPAVIGTTTHRVQPSLSDPPKSGEQFHQRGVASRLEAIASSLEAIAIGSKNATNGSPGIATNGARTLLGRRPLL